MYVCISLRSFALSFWMSSKDEISISLYLRTILKGELALKCALGREMLADHLFERTAGSAPASLSCVRGY